MVSFLTPTVSSEFLGRISSGNISGNVHVRYILVFLLVRICGVGGWGGYIQYTSVLKYLVAESSDAT